MTDPDLMISILNKRLPAGVKVASCLLRDSYTRSAQISHWDVCYSGIVDLPDRIVVKSTSNHLDSIRREGEFYALAQTMKYPVELTPFIGWIATPSNAALVMEDMTPFFKPSINKPSAPPSLAINAAIFCSLCKIHNGFLGHPKIHEFPVEHLSGMLANRMSMNRETILKNLRTHSQSTSSASLFSRIIDYLPSLLRTRFSRNMPMTIIHGDFHPGNVLLSWQDVPPRVLIIDWPNWQPGFPTDDLAYYLTLCFPPIDREAQETHLLHMNYERLSEEFRSFYTWETFQFDYRVSILRSMAVAFLWLACDAPQDWAWESLEFALDAYRTWECDSIVECL